MAGSTLYVGIGSPHGDDQVGWLVMEELKKHVAKEQCRQARTPAQLLDWLEDLDELVVCDGLQSTGPAAEVRFWEWPAPDLAGVQFQGSHDLSLCAALELAEQLGRLPAKVRIWGVRIESARPTEGISTRVAESASLVARRILQERIDA